MREQSKNDKKNQNRNGSRNYDDIIQLPHPTSKTHPRMSCLNRAAQFAPFAALSGHDEAIKETARLVEEKILKNETQDGIEFMNP